MTKDEKQEEAVYSLNSLVPEITDKDDFYDEDYDNAVRQVYRLFSAIQKAMGPFNQGLPKIKEADRETFVRFMAKFYEDSKFKRILKKIETGKDVSLEEYDLILDFLVDNLAQDMPEDEKKDFLDMIEFNKDDESYEMAEKIGGGSS